MKFESTFTLGKILVSENLAEDLSEEELSTLGIETVKNYEKDRTSRYEWEQRNEEALKLALQVVEPKSFPWPNAANIKFPLITIAALQYHARAYPALIPGVNVLKCHNISEHILAKDLVVSYYTKSLETAPRISHVMEMSRNELHQKVIEGVYRDIDLGDPFEFMRETLAIAQDETQGTSPTYDDNAKPHTVIEQHCLLDLDGDGYEEPYIVVVHKDSKKVLRVVARFFQSGIKQNKDGEVLSITAENYFTKFPFIPSPDGGFYDLGFGVLLGPLNETINTLINQLLDAGTISTTGGGFLARGIKIRGGSMSFTPNEWKPVDTTGDDLRKGIFPLPTKEPSNVLFQLLSLLINYGERIGGSVDILVGENPVQNTPAETSRTMAEQGMKVFSGIFKRTYRSLKQEFKKLYRLNQLYMTENAQLGSIKILVDDYNADATSIVPAADPHMISDSQKVAQSGMLMQLAGSSSGFNMYEVQKRVLQAWKVGDIDILLPDPKGPNAI